MHLLGISHLTTVLLTAGYVRLVIRTTGRAPLLRPADGNDADSGGTEGAGEESANSCGGPRASERTELMTALQAAVALTIGNTSEGQALMNPATALVAADSPASGACSGFKGCFRNRQDLGTRGSQHAAVEELPAPLCTTDLSSLLSP